ncbi:hypothetical protein C7M84_025309 [Penaeus vannamei]|uniref:Clu domain-containing protein n=1 Tax=Penaeus vannamei TaxID=6689 RepID=A0A3R7MN88_PENVA|nr:hypothetical protein C7M84_025309 [Penaeus vannamei]
MCNRNLIPTVGNGDDSSTEGHEKAETESQEKSEETKGTEEIKDNEDKEEALSQEYGFTVRIKPPYGDSFSIQVSSMELVQEIHQLLMDREDTCHRTCFSLHLDGQTLDNFAELKTIEGLKEGSVIRIQEEPYTVREARIHVRHVRDLLKSLDPIDALNGVDCASLSFLNTVTHGDVLEKKKKSSESVDCTPPKYILPNCKDRQLIPLQPTMKEQKSPQCLKVLTMSGWNPPPGPRKLHGDLMYLYVVTLEGKHFHITASTWGFYLNQTSEEEFNPRPANPSYLCHSLIDLLNMLSAAFKRNFANLQKKRTSRHPFERVATPYQVYAWASPMLEHGIDALRAEDAFSSKLGYEEHIPGQTRDWNEELQTTRELARRTLPERLLRERAIFKVHSDFVAAATRGAMAVIDGNVMAINPGEDPKMQMFIWNNIFFSLGFDVRDHYKEVGGDAAAHVAPRNDLQGVRVYSATDLEGLYTLGTVVVDYRGYRVTAQSIIPGILEREQEQSVVYGSIDFGKTVVTHPKYMDLLQKAGQQLKILPHKVLNEKNEEIELCSSVECKGIIGNDGRHYILDLLRTFPPDVNFLELEDAHLGPASRELGFPVIHKHKLATLRQELVDAFVDNRYMMFLKYAALHLQQLSEIEAEEAKKIVENVTESIAAEKQVEENTKDIIKKAAAAVGSLKEADFDIRFNPDVYSPGVQHSEPEGEQLKKERKLVCDAAEFLVSVALKLLYRARYLLLLIHGEVHPEVSLVDSNIGLILHAVGQYSLSLQFLEKSLELNCKFFGDKSLKVALSYHLVARTQSCMGDFRGALKNEKETFTIYKSQLGPEHEKTKEADECLRHLTQQAVVMAKKISEAYNGRSTLGLPPIQIQPPSMTSVLELLNIINGILYVQITPAEIERVRAELEKSHAKALEEKSKTKRTQKTKGKNKELDLKNEESDAKSDESDSKSEDDDSKKMASAEERDESDNKSEEETVVKAIDIDIKSEEEEEPASR